jgi:ComEC/Rec2-related protein
MGSISGMVLGLRHQTPEDIEEPFQQTGTLHLFAVAGLHVGIVARLLWILATVVRLPRKWATALIIPALLFYAAVTGLHTSSVRAAVMSAVLLAGFLVERKVFALNSLAAAATPILCWNTNELFSVGFQLSFSVVAAIVVLAEPTYRFLRRRFEPDSFLPRSLFGSRPPHHRPLRLVARTRQLGFVRGLDRFFAVDALVLLLGYADLVAGDPCRGSDRFLRSRGRSDVDVRSTAFNVAVGCYVRNFSEYEPVDLRFAESRFERAWRTMRFRIGADHKLRRLTGETFDFPEVIGLIRRYAQQAVRSKCTMNRREKIFRYDPAAPMPSFGPGIGKHQMKQCDRIRWKHLPNSIGSLHPQNARVRELALRNFPVCSSHSPEETFNSKKIPCRISRGDFHEKGPVSASKIDLDRSASTIDGLQIERRKITRRNDFDVRSQSKKFSGLKHLN